MWQTVFLLRKLPLHAIVVLCLSLLVAVCLEAQVRVLEESWRWIHFTEKDGLSSKQVYSLLEAEDGTILEPLGQCRLGLSGNFKTAVELDSQRNN